MVLRADVRRVCSDLTFRQDDSFVDVCQEAARERLVNRGPPHAVLRRFADEGLERGDPLCEQDLHPDDCRRRARGCRIGRVGLSRPLEQRRALREVQCIGSVEALARQLS